MVLDFETLPHLRAIDRAHEFVLGRVAEALRQHVPAVSLAGTSDLVIDIPNERPKKFSGNALRIKRNHFLYHGTILYNFDLPLVESLLATPTRTPDYRLGRGHREFITNLPLDRETVVGALTKAWQANESLVDWPRERTLELVHLKYDRVD